MMQKVRYAFGVRSELVGNAWKHQITRKDLTTGQTDDVGRSYSDSERDTAFNQARRWEENQRFPGYFYPEPGGPQSYGEYLAGLNVC